MSEEKSAVKPDLENSYELKIKEEKAQLERDYHRAKNKYMQSIYSGIIFLIISVTLVIYIIIKNSELEEAEKRIDEDWSHAHLLRMKKKAHEKFRSP